MAEIKNFEGLEKALGELMLEKGTGPFHEEVNYYNVLGLINSFEAGVIKQKITVPFDTEKRPSILDRCVRCNHPFQSHNPSCWVKNCDCGEFMIEAVELRSLLEGEGGGKEMK